MPEKSIPQQPKIWELKLELRSALHGRGFQGILTAGSYEPDVNETQSISVSFTGSADHVFTLSQERLNNALRIITSNLQADLKQERKSSKGTD